MSLLKNTTWNILGFAIPVVVAIPAMGYMARVLGVEKFGIFTLCYAVVGYASLFDLGLSRAVVRAVAMNASSEERIAKIIGTASCFVLILSVLAACLLYFSTDWLVMKLSVSADSAVETKSAFELLSLAVPALLLSMVWFSYLEGLGSFYKLNVLKALSGLSVVLFPLLTVICEPSLVSAIVGLVAGRVVSMLISYLWGLWEGSKHHLWKMDSLILRELLSFGGWITVSNIISPVMVYFDRFFISSFVGAKSVAFYTAPAEAVARLLIIPIAVSKVVFPRLSARHKGAEAEARFGFWLLLGGCLFLAIAIGFFSEDILLLWMGADYLGEAVTVLRILLVGFVFNAIAQIPFTKIQASGNARVTALLHMGEVVPYFCILYYLVLNFSLVGAAIAWVLRVALDCIMLEFLSRKYK
ncbi:flippase [Azotobacter chroococcum]|uniref:flippase n=1 Tax=Azotobacter chroococcum TaxID=353 RepID=UPI00103C036D|nr:flippase [Azotobacter chroococcum]TBW02231.1 flippase [Azotobacter chroococcum]